MDSQNTQTCTYMRKMRDLEVKGYVVSPQVGTSSIVYPAAMFGPQVASRGVPVAEFNMATTPKTEYFT